MSEKVIAFLAELQELCKKHKATINGCGCCSSPFGTVDGIKFDDLSADAEKVVANEVQE